MVEVGDAWAKACGCDQADGWELFDGNALHGGWGLADGLAQGSGYNQAGDWYLTGGWGRADDKTRLMLYT